MNILAIESSATAASVAIVTETGIKAEYTLNIKKTHSQTLLPMLDELMKNTETDIGEIDYVAVSCGPGSFAGLRIGMATAKAIAYAIGVPCVAVKTLHALAAGIENNTSEVKICPITDARRQHLYCGIYEYREGDDIPKQLRQDALMSYEELSEELKSSHVPIIFTGDGIEVAGEYLKEALGDNASFVSVTERCAKASWVGKVALSMIENGEVVTAEEIVPEYIRPSQAERLKNTEKNIQTRLMTEKDVPEVAEIERNSINPPWSEKSFNDALKDKNALYVVAVSDNNVAGYAGMWISTPEAEITNVACDTKMRRKGVAGKAVKTLLEKGMERGVNRFVLEVRSANIPAIKLYEQLGFKKIGTRKDFYESPREDAIIYEKVVAENIKK